MAVELDKLDWRLKLMQILSAIGDYASQSRQLRGKEASVEGFRNEVREDL